MDNALASPAHGLLDDSGQLGGGEDGSLLYDAAGDVAAPALFTEAPEDIRQLFLPVPIDNIGCGELLLRTKAHVQRTFTTES